MNFYISIFSECSLKSSDSSLMKVVNEKETSSSDSKLYKHTGVLHKCPSTYPWISNASACDNLTEFCDTDGNSSLRKNSGLYRDNKLGCFGSLFTNNEGDEENMYSLKKETQVITEKVDFDKNFSVLSLSQKSSGCERNSSDNVRCTPSSVASSESENGIYILIWSTAYFFFFIIYCFFMHTFTL